MATTVTSIELQPARDVHSVTYRDNSSTQNIIQASAAVDSEAPEGGYGWLVIAGCSVITFWYNGLSYSWGVVQAALVEYGKYNALTLSFVGSLMPACISFLGILNGRVIRKIGARPMAMIGVFCLGLGAILSGFTVNNIGGLFMTAGILMGIGLSLCFMVVSVVPAQYFKAKRGRANGIVYAVGGLGGGVLSFVTNALVQKVGAAWTFRILGLVTWASALPATWFLKERVPIRSSGFVEWNLFRDSRFVLLFIAGAIGTFPIFVPPFFLPMYARSIGLSSSAGAGLVAASNFSSAAGRLLCGFGSDFIGPVNALLASLLISAISLLAVWPISTSLAPLMVFVIINGAANGGFFACMPTVVGNTFGSLRVSTAMGMIVSGWAGGYLLGAPIAGFILDASGGDDGPHQAYRPPIFYAGGMAAIAAILVGFIRFRMDRHLLRKV